VEVEEEAWWTLDTVSGLIDVYSPTDVHFASACTAVTKRLVCAVKKERKGDC